MSSPIYIQYTSYYRDLENFSSPPVYISSLFYIPHFCPYTLLLPIYPATRHLWPIWHIVLKNIFHVIRVKITSDIQSMYIIDLEKFPNRIFYPCTYSPPLSRSLDTSAQNDISYPKPCSMLQNFLHFSLLLYDIRGYRDNFTPP